MNETLKQIEALAKQIEVLTAQLETEQEAAAFDFQHILDEAKQTPFRFHDVATCDEHVKVQYMHMLLTLFDYAQTKLEERYLLAGKIYYALGIETDFMELLRKSKTLTPDDARSFVTLMQEQELVEHFVMDLLMIACVQQQDKLMRYVAEIVAALAVSEERFRTYCYVTNAILTVNHEALNELLLKSESLRVAVGHYLMVIHSNFAPMIVIEGDGKQVVKVSELRTERLHLKNVQIELLSNYHFMDYEELVLENCVICCSHISLSFSNINKLVLKNIRFAQFKKVSTLQVTNCHDVLLSELYFEKLEVQGAHLMQFKKIKHLRVEACEFHMLDINRSAQVESLLNESIENFEAILDRDEPLLDLKDVVNFTEHNVRMTKCESCCAYIELPILRLV